MKRKLVLVAALVALAVPSASRAQLSLGARVGYAWGMGDVGGDPSGNLKMSDWIKGQVPIQVDAMFRLAPGLAVGGYFSYGFGQAGGQLKDTVCDVPGVDCTPSNMRLGVQATWAIPAGGGFLPWVGLGTGYEWSKLHASGPGGSGDVKFRGWEILNLQLGGDFLATPLFRVGPFVMLSLGRYSTAESTGDLAGAVTLIPEKKVHEWLQLGVRGTFDI